MLLNHISQTSPAPTVLAVLGEVLITTETIHVDRSDTTVEPTEWPTEYAGVSEYSVGLWLRWQELSRVEWEVIYLLTSQEPDVRGNLVRAADRLLSAYQHRDRSHLFSTYTD